MRKLWIALLVCCLVAGSALAESKNFVAVRINEFMASNGETLEDENGNSPDWIELYNSSDEDINLEGLCLSDGKKTLDKFVFPAVTIPAHGYLIIFCSGEDRVTETEIHTAFKLSADGERVVLSYQGVILDIVSFDMQTKDISMARDVDGRWEFTSHPTPGAENVIE